VSVVLTFLIFYSVGALAEQSTWENIRLKLRAGSFTEYMTPAFSGNPFAIPTPGGDPLSSHNISSFFWTDYQIGDELRFLYFQKHVVNFAALNSNSSGIIFRNPRFAIRKTKVFDHPNILSVYDFYLQPGIAPEADPSQAGRAFEVGFRTNTTYALPGSNWNIGFISEFTYAFLNKSTGSDMYGGLTPWLSYTISKRFKTNHNLTVNFLHPKGDTLFGFQPDTPLPYIQNGVGFNVSDSLSASFLLNNYLSALPSIQNTWASVWLNVIFL
jgi:hypothetical protein